MSYIGSLEKEVARLREFIDIDCRVQHSRDCGESAGFGVTVCSCDMAFHNSKIDEVLKERVLPQPEEDSDPWLPISTAPKDRRIQLLRSVKGPVFGRWDADEYAKNPCPFWTNDQIRLWGVRTVRAEQPTHWKPVSTLEVL